MKRFIHLIIALFTFSLGFADIVIEMEPYGGVYRIPCFVNGAKMKFIFDTGASNVCLSMTMAEYLFDNGYIDERDIVGVGSSSLADGRIVDHIKLRLKDIQVGDLHINNVEAVVVDGQNAPLLMGQSAIQKLGSIEINGNLLVIHNDDGVGEEYYITKLKYDLADAMVNQLYDKALPLFERLNSMNQLDDFEKYWYAICLCQQNDHKEAIEILNSIKDVKSLFEQDCDFYYEYARNYFCLAEFSKAIRYMELSGEHFMKPGDFETFAENRKFIADCYYFQQSYKQANNIYWQAFVAYSMLYGIDSDYLWNDCRGKLKKNQKSYRSDAIDEIAYKYALTAGLCGEWSTETSKITIVNLAKARNSYAMDFLNDADINPYDY